LNPQTSSLRSNTKRQKSWQQQQYPGVGEQAALSLDYNLSFIAQKARSRKSFGLSVFQKKKKKAQGKN